MKYTIKSLILLLTACCLHGCYGIQESYDYKPAKANPYLNQSVWEYIESRQDIFSLFKECVEHVDAAYPGFKDLYTQTTEKYTYLLLTNNAFSGTQGIFNQIGGSTAITEVDALDPEKLRDALLYHIVEGHYHSLDVSGSLSFSRIYVVTLLKKQDAIMTMKLEDNTGRNYYTRLVVNENTGSSLERWAKTSNLVATNGIIHIFDSYIYYKPAL